jgi:hypothetical protein
MRYASKTILLLLGGWLLMCLGCGKPSRTATRRAEPIPWARPSWGPQVEGVQCLLRPVKRRWPVEESPTFEIDVRNRGQRIFAFPAADDAPLDRIAIDGRWHRWLRPAGEGVKMWPLAPGVEFNGLSATLPETLRSSLSPGRHMVQVAFVFEGVEVLSNVVTIELLPAS